MDQHHVETIVLTVLGAVLKSEVHLNSSRLNTPHWDSLKHIEIIFAVEDELGIEFSENEIATLDSVAVIVDRAMVTHAA